MFRLLFTVLLLIVTAISVAQPPANNECTTATLITVSPSIACSNSISATSLDATQSMAPCKGSMAEDVWFQFTATDTKLILQLNSQSLYNPVVQLFSGSCGNLTSLGCYDNPSIDPFSPNSDLRQNILGLTIGNTYYLRVYADYAMGAPFTLCLYHTGSNDECTGAIDIPVNNGLSWTSYTAGSNKSNTASGAGCISASNRADGWFKFTAQDSVHQIYMEGSPSTINSSSTRMNVYAGSCGSLTPVPGVMYGGVATNCFFPGPGNGNNFALRGLTAGNTYYVKIEQDMSYFEDNNDSFKIAISNVPANDGITGAQEIPVNPGTDCISKATGNFLNASATVGTEKICPGQPYPYPYGTDLWYKFTATASRHLLAAYFNPDVEIPNYMVYSMNSGNLQPLTCGVGGGSYYFNDLTALTPGAIYYVKVSTAYAERTDRLFDLCITTPTSTPANDDCAAAQIIPVQQKILSSTSGANFTAGMFGGCNSTGAAQLDVWHKFTPSIDASAILQFIIPNDYPYSRPGIELYTGACGALTRIDCKNIEDAGKEHNIGFIANAGITYYVRIFDGATGTPYSTPYSLSISEFVSLPVTITAFEAAYTPNGSIKLLWKTEEESHIKYYEIERSKNGYQFNHILSIPARNASFPSEYTGEDLSPLAGVNYYRLKIVDQDGKSEYSKIVKVNTNSSFTGNLHAGRQGNLLWISNQNSVIKNANVTIFTATGQRIYSAVRRLTTGVNTIVVPGKINQTLFIQVVTEANESKTFKIF